MGEENVIKINGVALKSVLLENENSKGIAIVLSKIDWYKKEGKTIIDGLIANGLSVLIVDLFTSNTGKDDVDLLTDRLVGVTKWCEENDRLKKMQIVYLGVGVTAAAVLSAAAYWGLKIKASVCVEGRPDLAGDVLDLVETPSLLIVSSGNKEISDRNRFAYIHLGCEKKTENIPGVNNLFEDSKTIQKVSDLITRWFTRHLLN